MKIKKLFKGISKIQLKGPKETEVMGLCSDSRRVAPGDLFFAKRGKSFKGTDFIADAVLSGATSIVTDIYNPFLVGISQIITSDVDGLESIIASRFYDQPSSQLFNIGITGTNGKTTISYLLRHLLSGDQPVGMISTIETATGKHNRPSELTTPDCIAIHKLQKEMLANNCHYSIMEVTSIGLVQDRLNLTRFDRLVFTNLSRDHLDAHGSMENYLLAKQSFFTNRYAKEGAKAIVNDDALETEEILSQFNGEVLSYGLTSKATCFATSLIYSSRGVEFDLNYLGECVHVKLPMKGEYNVVNALAASLIALSCNALSLKQIAAKLATFPGIEGRLQRVSGAPFDIFVDFAHTPDALKNVLKALRENHKGKVITVFGAGGDRDKLKRPLMGEVVTSLSDIAIITSDNPRGEDPSLIVEDIKKGIVKNQCQVIEEVDRLAAILKGIELAKKGDILLIAGKGHERGQSLRNRTIDFDDIAVVKELLLLSTSTSKI
ncbi:MAG: UDP-N-acetylmuramoyl-L-alanyl-D-glutamate--2,6-diaminopimelate ligase [Rhabdochlamydiaceae bacterium]|nr:UDP-N-acetylmuramoyl-L-alanyl-D-glutamate--2,6-diaminopimelate ligase [Candidatus Amphrikana amoebophyrae]